MTALTRHIAVLNRSTVVEDDEVHAICRALQEQVTHHYAPLWGTYARLSFIRKDRTTGWEGKWNLVVLDTSDEANALGYHDLTPEGLPLGKCFAKTDQLAGMKLSVTMSHELLEMLGDPEINILAQADDGTIYAYENCDAVEADGLGYQVNGTTVSDFVTPEWFSSSGGETLDFCGHVKRPFQLAPGGYISVLKGGAWTQIYARTDPMKFSKPDPLARAAVGSRRERRRVPRSDWRRSRE